MAQPPCWINFMTFIIETTLGAIPVQVLLNLKLDPDGGENTTSLL